VRHLSRIKECVIEVWGLVEVVIWIWIWVESWVLVCDGNLVHFLDLILIQVFDFWLILLLILIVGGNLIIIGNLITCIFCLFRFFIVI
jgi:hypothetical protein